MAPTLKVVYFPLPGRAEPIRLAAHVGGLQIEDQHVDGAAWGELKAKEKLGPMQLPLLYVDGEAVGQSGAQQRYIGRLAGLYPEDARAALTVDEITEYVGEVFTPIGKTFGIKDEDEKKKARAELVAEGGDVHKWLVYIDGRLAGKKYAVGDSLTMADIQIFSNIQMLASGWLDGIPATVLDQFKNIAAHKTVVANHDKVKEYYASAEGLRSVYKA